MIDSDMQQQKYHHDRLCYSKARVLKCNVFAQTLQFKSGPLPLYNLDSKTGYDEQQLLAQLPGGLSKELLESMYRLSVVQVPVSPMSCALLSAPRDNNTISPLLLSSNSQLDFGSVLILGPVPPPPAWNTASV